MARPSKEPIRLTPLGKWINEYRAEHGDMSLEAFAAEMGYSHGHLSKVMRGKAKPSPQFVKKLAYATGATENDLLVIAYGRPRLESARAGAKRIMQLSGTVHEALNGLARLIEPLSPADQRIVIGWFSQLARMSHNDRAKAIREITAYLKQLD